MDHLSAMASGTSRKDRIQAMILPSLMEWLADTADPDAGLLAYRKLSEAAFDSSWFLRLLRDENIVGQAPDAHPGDFALCRRPVHRLP
jgi:glutamate-ammonia-ligase adenylyltransferase